jgi:hypothetical protein
VIDPGETRYEAVVCREDAGEQASKRLGQVKDYLLVGGSLENSQEVDSVADVRFNCWHAQRLIMLELWRRAEGEGI